MKNKTISIKYLVKIVELIKCKWKNINQGIIGNAAIPF
jgi:hypothetical protein